MAYFIHDEELGYIFHFLMREFLFSNNSFNGLQSSDGKWRLETHFSPLHKVFFSQICISQPLNLFIFFKSIHFYSNIIIFRRCLSACSMLSYCFCSQAPLKNKYTNEMNVLKVYITLLQCYK